MTLSVLMSVYKNDNPRWFKECFESLVKQSKPATEIIVVKDGKLNASLDSVIDEFKNKLPLKVVGYEDNHGLAYALNYGMDFCTCDLIARMDSDDICFPERFEKQIHEFEINSDLNILGTGVEEFYISDEKIENKNIRLYPERTNKNSKTLYKGTPLAHPTVMIRSEILKKYKYNLKNQKYSQDIELWFRLLLNGFEICTLQEPLLHFRITDKTFQRRNISKANTEFKIYMSYLYKLNGISPLLLYPVVRLFSRFFPVSLIKRMYFSKSRQKLFNK